MEHEVIRSRRKTFSAQIRQDKLLVRAPLWATDAQIGDFLQKHRRWIETHSLKAQQAEKVCKPLTDAELHALAEKALAVIPARVRYYAPLVGVTYGRITIRCQKSRWGSCSSKGNLNFNCLLMLAPPEVLDSVVVHELCHRKEMNHSDSFYAEVLRVLPNYRECHGWLKENGSRLMAMVC